MHRIPAPAQHPRALESGCTRTDHEKRIVSGTRRYVLRVPALAPLFAHGGVLRTPDRRHGVVAGHTDIAPYAFADVIDVSALDFFGQKGVRDGGAGGADQVQNPAPNLRHHGVGRSEAADADHGLGRHRLDEAHEFFLIAFGRESRSHRVIGPVADIDVPEIRQLREHCDDLAAFVLGTDAVGASQFIDGEAHGDGAIATYGLLGVLDQFPQQARTVDQAPAVFVAALVMPALQIVHGQ